MPARFSLELLYLGISMMDVPLETAAAWLSEKHPVSYCGAHLQECGQLAVVGRPGS